MTIRTVGLLGAVTMLVGCTGGQGGGGSASVRDSAGVSIVENSGPAWTEAQAWKVVDSPLIDVGDIDRAIGPIQLGGGQLVVANAGSNEVRIYGTDGVRHATSGRAGSGPGEYQTLAGIWKAPGDSIVVSDLLVRRVSVLDSAGNFARSFMLGGATASMMPTNGRFDFAIPLGVFGDGAVVGMSQSFSLGGRDGIYRDTVSMIRYAPDGSVRDTIGRFPGIEMEQMTLTVQGRSMPVPSPVPLGRTVVALANGERFYHSSNDRWEIEVRTSNGGLSRIVRSEIRPTPITEADAAEHRKQQIELMEGQPMLRNLPAEIKKQFTERIEKATYPKTYPFFVAMLADDQGNLWIQESVPTSEKSQQYAVVDTSGRFLGRVRFPANFHPAAIGGDVAYGVWKDADDVEHLRAYRLRKGGASGS